MLHVDMDIAQVVIPEGAFSPRRADLLLHRPTIEPCILEDAPDAVAVEVGQEVPQHEGQVIESELGGATQMANDRALFLGRFPGQPPGLAAMIRAPLYFALAPFAHRLVADAEASG